MSTSSTEDASLVVFVNGEVCPLLEDLRLPLYAYFPDAILMDPSTNPPTEMLLCTSADEYGITQRKLLPNGCYEAYFRGVDGRICPVVKKAGTWAYVMNLPPHTTPKMLGTYFEEFDQVQEANVFRGRHAQCTGRGWVVLHDPSKMDLVPPALEFYNTIITVELSSVEPSQRCLPPLPPPPIGRSSVGLAPRLGIRDAPPPPPPPPSRSRLTTGVAPIGDHLTLNSPNISTSSSSSSSRASYFLFYVNAVELNALHQDRYFRPGIAKLEIMYRAQRMSGAGATYLLFVLRHCPVWTLVGVAKMAATRVPGEDGCSLEWVLAHLHLVESDVRHIAGSNVLFRCKDGAAVRGEVGAELLSMAEQVPCPPTHTNSNGNNNGSASSNHHHTPPPPPPSYRGGRGGGAMTRGRGGMPARGGAARRAPPPPLAIGADLPPPPPRPSGW